MGLFEENNWEREEEERRGREDKRKHKKDRMIVGKVWPPIPPHTKLSHGSCTYSYNKTAYLLIICIVFSASKSLLPSKIFWLVYLQSGKGLAGSKKSRNRSRSRSRKQKAAADLRGLHQAQHVGSSLSNASYVFVSLTSGTYSCSW